MGYTVVHTSFSCDNIAISRYQAGNGEPGFCMAVSYDNGTPLDVVEFDDTVEVEIC